MKVIIPVAGEGTRLRPHTHTIPKSLLYVGGKPILGHILDQLEDIDFSEVVFVTGLHGDKIEKYVKENYSFKATFVEQRDLYGLGYAVKLGIVDASEDLLIILGDTIVEIDWQGLVNSGRNLLSVMEVEDPRAFGVAEVEGDKITKLVEKPKEPKSNLAVVGVYYIKDTVEFQRALNEVIDRGITSHGEIQLTDAFALFAEGGGELFIFPTKAWYDCGRRETILETNRFLLLRNAKETKREGSIIIPPSFVAATAVVENSIIGPYASIGRDAVVKNSIVTDSIISIGARVEAAILEKSLIGNYALVKGRPGWYNVGDSSEVGLA